MAKILINGEFVVSCSEHCLYCMVSDICNRESIEMTEDEFEMLQVCRKRRGNLGAACDDCPYRFLCYTTTVNKYAGKSSHGKEVVQVQNEVQKSKM